MNPMLADLPLWLDAVLALLVIAGTLFALVGSWGLAKLGDFLLFVSPKDAQGRELEAVFNRL